MKYLKKRNFILLLLSFTLVVGITAIITTHYSNFHKKIRITINGTVLPNPRMIQPFELINTQGKLFTNKDLKGHWTLIFFGFTHCPDVCPTTLSEISKAYFKLESTLPPKLLPTVIMVTIDPERDSISNLNDYLEKFNPKFIALRGNMDATKYFANQMSVAFGKVNLQDGKLTLSHSARIILLDPDGNIRAFFSYPHRSDILARDYKKVVLTVSKRK